MFLKSISSISIAFFMISIAFTGCLEDDYNGDNHPDHHDDEPGLHHHGDGDYHHDHDGDDDRTHEESDRHHNHDGSDMFSFMMSVIGYDMGYEDSSNVVNAVDELMGGFNSHHDIEDIAHYDVYPVSYTHLTLPTMYSV